MSPERVEAGRRYEERKVAERPKYTRDVLPPDGFMKDLKAIDERLTARWNADIQRWEIFLEYNGRGKVDIHILTVQGPHVVYRPLDYRTLHRLYLYDTARWGLKEVVRRVSEALEQWCEENHRRTIEEVDAVIMDARKYLAGVLQVQVPRNYGSWKERPSGLVVPR